MAYRRWDKVFVSEGVSQQNWIEEHAGEYTVDEMVLILARTKHSVQQKLLKEGLRARPPVRRQGTDSSRGSR